MNTTARNPKLVELENQFTKLTGVKAELTYIVNGKFSILADGKSQAAVEKFQKFLGAGVTWDAAGIEYDADLECTYAYFTLVNFK